MPLHRILIYIGLALVALGLLAWLLQGKLHWFGRLPGDIRVEREGYSFYAPITSMILVSLAINLIIWLVRRFLSN